MTDIFSYYQLAATKRESKGDKSVLIVHCISNYEYATLQSHYNLVTGNWLLNLWMVCV